MEVQGEVIEEVLFDDAGDELIDLVGAGVGFTLEDELHLGKHLGQFLCLACPISEEVLCLPGQVSGRSRPGAAEKEGHVARRFLKRGWIGR